MGRAVRIFISGQSVSKMIMKILSLKVSKSKKINIDYRGKDTRA